VGGGGEDFGVGVPVGFLWVSETWADWNAPVGPFDLFALSKVIHDGFCHLRMTGNFIPPVEGAWGSHYGLRTLFGGHYKA
jgi:hypothetical protein